MSRISGRIIVCIWGVLVLSNSFLRAAEDAPPAAAPRPAIELGAPFADDALLQRGMKVPVWDWSKPGTEVTVEFQGQKKSAKAGGKAADSVAHGPMFKAYSVKGNELIVEFEHAEGGLLVAETETNAKAGKIAIPTVIPDGDDKVQLFYLAGDDLGLCRQSACAGGKG